MFIAFVIYLFTNTIPPLAICVLMVVPTVVDGAIQAVYRIMSNNRRRFITGLIGGAGAAWLGISLMNLSVEYIVSNVILLQDK